MEQSTPGIEHLTTKNDHEELIDLEIANTLAVLHAQGVDPIKLILHGSAARDELRTAAEDSDPSDIDLLAIVSSDDRKVLEDMARRGMVGRTMSSTGAVSFIAKIPSKSGQLNPAEVDLYTAADLVKELSGDPQSQQRTSFVTAAVAQGRTLLENEASERGTHRPLS